MSNDHDPENPTRVQRATPMDVTAIHDPGMKALVLLAASLGWNIIHKPNNPILLKARDGRERRIPTNTSIRMSVFQANLSTILTHSPGYEPTAGLIDDIVRKTKVDRDHERRLRISVTEPAEIHEARVANAERGVVDIPKGEHLTQRIKLPEVSGPPVPNLPADIPEDVHVQLTAVPFDGQVHGRIVSRHPFMAKYHGTRTKPGLRYPSESSYERVWEDDYKDYECMHCGMVKGSPQAVGSHKQVHVKAGEIVASPPSAVMARTKGKPVQTEAVTAGDGEAAIRVSKLAAPAATVPIATDAEKILNRITELIAPNLRELLDNARRERDELQVKYDALESNLNALRELLGGLQ